MFPRRRSYLGLGPRPIYLGSVWSSNGHFHWGTTGDTGGGPPGRSGYSCDADRGSIHRGLGNWSNVCHYSRLLCTRPFHMPFFFFFLSNVSLERGRSAADSRDAGEYPAVDDRVGNHGRCTYLPGYPGGLTDNVPSNGRGMDAPCAGALFPGGFHSHFRSFRLLSSLVAFGFSRSRQGG